MAITRSIASSNLQNAVTKKNPEVFEKKITTRACLQRSALGNISNKGTLVTKPDALKGLKEKNVVENVVNKKKSVLASTKQKITTAAQPPVQRVEPIAPAVTMAPVVQVAPVVRAAPVEEKRVEIVCQRKVEPARQEPIIEVPESPECEESSIEVDLSASSVSMDTSANSDAGEMAAANKVAFSNQMYTLVLRDIDEEDADNPQLVSEYAKDIYRYMGTLETEFSIRQNHLSIQTEVNGRMRAILVDWLVQVHQRFHLLQETLFLTVAILDRYLQVEVVSKTRLQLAGVASMWIAAKYEEMYAPEVADFAYITDHAYTKADIRHMECAILRALDFQLGRPLPIHFLRRFSKAGDVNARTHNLAKYFMELAMIPCETAHIKPSFLAACALRLAQKLLGEFQWDSVMIYYTGYDESALAPLMAKLCQTVLGAGGGKTTAVKTKYQSSKLMKVSLLDELSEGLLHEIAAWPTTPLFQN